MSDLYPYRKYSRYPLRRQRRYYFRMNHDVWCWVLAGLSILGFVLLEVMR